MRVTKIRVDNFKSLVGFEMELAKFTCLIGTNGSGKSTVLQFFDFLTQLVRGRMDTWLEDRGWSPEELVSSFSGSRLIKFDVEVEAHGEVIRWSGAFDTRRLRCVQEIIERDEDQVKLDSQGFVATQFEDGTPLRLRLPANSLRYQGSIMSTVDAPTFPNNLVALRDFFLTAHSLELLSPEDMRVQGRHSPDSVGIRGEGLSAYVHDMPADQLARILDRVQSQPTYKRLESIQSKSLRAGWKQLSVGERFGDQSLATRARHVNDGLLRLIAVLSELESGRSMLLFDEVENGVNIELVEFLTRALAEAEPQIVVTTHSPVILNFLPDDVARAGTVFLYKAPDGATRAAKFFDVPGVAAKLAYMGPGEAMLDTRLIDLADELERTHVPADEWGGADGPGDVQEPDRVLGTG